MELVWPLSNLPWTCAVARSKHVGVELKVRHWNPVHSKAGSLGSSSSSRKPDFYEDEEYDSEEEEQERRDEQMTRELQWATRARQLAIQDMRTRNFTDRDFEALLPPHLRLVNKPNKKKKLKKKLETLLRSERAEPTASSLVPSTSQTTKKKTKEKRTDVEEQAVEGGKVAPEQLEALVRKFNTRRSSLLDVNDESDSELDSEFSVVYAEREGGEEDSDLSDSDDEPVKDPRLQEIHFNQDVVEARDLDEVLGTVARALGKFELSPINVATALHRIAKHMIHMSMSELTRLKYARQSDVAELVARAMEILPQCSAQGLSNIAWALSKIGGHLLYTGEMEVVSSVALTKVEEMNPQNVANVAGAFASMQHSSPGLFEKLAAKASQAGFARGFKAQELAQLLWSFACLSQPAGSVLDALDEVLKLKEADQDLSDDESKQDELTLELLASLAWSYAVFGQLQRPFFGHICKKIVEVFEEDHSIGQHKNMRQLTQLHQVILALKLEGNPLSIVFGERIQKLASAAWEKERSSRKSTSFLQVDIERFLVCTGRKWIPEYIDADYSLDFACTDEKVAIEVNGPSHFTRNTGELLGHTVLKHRLLSASGWKVISASFAEWENLQGESEHVDFIQKLVAPYFT